MSKEEREEEFQRRFGKYVNDEEFKKHLEYLAFREKESNPDKIVLCPRCGNRLIYKENGNSYTIICATDDCMNITCRGVKKNE